MSITPPPLTTDTVEAIDQLKRALQQQAAAEHNVARVRREIAKQRDAHDAIALQRVREYEKQADEELCIINREIVALHGRRDILLKYKCMVTAFLCPRHEFMANNVCTECKLTASDIRKFEACNYESIRRRFDFFDECVEGYEPMPEIPE